MTARRSERGDDSPGDPAYRTDGGEVETSEVRADRNTAESGIDRRQVGDDPESSSGLEVLLIEDNSGDARLIREMFRDAGELTRRIDPDATAPTTPEVTHAKRLAEGLETAEEQPVDVVLLDLNLPDSSGLETVETADRALDALPIVVLTGVSDQQTGIEAIQHGAEEYLVKDEVTSALLVRTIHHAIERKQQAIERERRRELLATLNRLNRIGQDITHAVIRSESRDELERAVCDRLVAPDGYRFAWVGSVSRHSQQVTASVTAGKDDDYLDAVEITIDDRETAGGPTGRAVHSQEVEVCQDVLTDPAYEPWRSEAAERGYRSAAAIPVAYDGVLYGVLNVYASEPDAFGTRKQRILGRMGEVVGHAIASLERKQALVSDEAIELEFTVEGFAEPLVELTEGDGSVAFNRFVRTDDSILCYGAASEIELEPFGQAVDALEVASAHRVLTPGTDTFDFEIVAVREIPLFGAIASHGGKVHRVHAENGSLRVVVEVPRRGNTGTVIESVEDACDGATFLAQRMVDRTDAWAPDQSTLETRLTEKQREALETAVFAGYFDWPRESTGEEVADRMGISPATFTQHLRAAEGKIFDAILREDEA